MKKTIYLLCVLLPVMVSAKPPGGGGPLPAEQREAIHSLFSGHKSIARQVTLTEKGYKARTTSKDPKVASLIQEHVAAMEARLDSGFPVRRWDPAFEEFFRHYDQMETVIRKIANGVEVEVTGKNPQGVKVAQNHAKIISGFVKNGEEEHHARHPAVLKEEVPAKGLEPGGKADCKKCGGACQGGKCGEKKEPASEKGRKGPGKQCACQNEKSGGKEPAPGPGGKE